MAYLDRPEERARDLTDVVYSFEHYEETLGGSRRFDHTGVEVEGQPILFEEAGAFLLGTEVARLARPNSLQAVRTFLAGIDNEYARPISQILSQERRMVDGESRRRTLFRLFRVFGAGLSEGAEKS